jgi:hypothetical protein
VNVEPFQKNLEYKNDDDGAVIAGATLTTVKVDAPEPTICAYTIGAEPVAGAPVITIVPDTPADTVVPVINNLKGVPVPIPLPVVVFPTCNLLILHIPRFAPVVAFVPFPI